MLENRPALKDRLTAGVVFVGIGIAAVAGFELIIGGIAPQIGPQIEARADYPSDMPQPWVPSSGAVPVTSVLPPEAPAEPVDAGGLAGGPDDMSAPGADVATGELNTDEDALYRELEALYADEVESVEEPPADEPSEEASGEEEIF
jgi:hypothetical protein